MKWMSLFKKYQIHVMFVKKENISARMRVVRSTEEGSVAQCVGGESPSVTNCWHRPLTRSQADRKQSKGAALALVRSDSASSSNSRPCSPATAVSRRPSLLVVKRRKSTPKSHNYSHTPKRITGSIAASKRSGRSASGGTKKPLHTPGLPGGSAANHTPPDSTPNGGAITIRRRAVGDGSKTLPNPAGRRNWDDVDRFTLNTLNQAVCDEDVDTILQLSKNSHKFLTGLAGQRALVSCGRAGATRLVRALLFAGVHPDAPALRELKEEDGYSPLHAAVHHGHLAAMDALLKGGAYVDTLTHSGLTPLHVAALHDRADCCVLLLSSGADPSAVDAQGKTPLALAAAFHCAAACSVFEIFWSGGIACLASVSFNGPSYRNGTN